MGGIVIIGLGKGYDKNAAAIDDYGSLYNALGGSSGRQSLTDRYIIVNGAGEDLPYSSQLHKQFDPQIVADFVKGGGVWIDYCGWPMYYTSGAGGGSYGDATGSGGWSSFCENLGYGWLASANFTVPPEITYNPYSKYPFPRGFPLAESLIGVCYPAGQTFAVNGTFNSYQQNLTGDGFSSMVVLHPPGGGYYFYATWVPTFEQVISSNVPGVPIDTYASYIQSVLTGNTSQLTCLAYKTNVQHVSSPTTSQSSPTTITGNGSSSSPGPSSSGSGDGVTVKTTTTYPSSSSGGSGSSSSGSGVAAGPSSGTSLSSLAVPFAAFGLILGGVGLGAYVLKKEKEARQ
ncbi:MAG: hypothetical protein M0Z85_00140 [Gammaproteobacteria bacterium]|nr:hypothetical protein [Gammaproteobacteria bacterium]